MNADTPLRFPTSTIFGRFFNDYLDGLPIAEIYAHYATEVYTEEECTILYLEGGAEEGRLTILRDNDAIIDVGCIIASTDVRYQLYSFVKENMVFMQTATKNVQVYGYNSKIFFFTYVYIEKDFIEESFSLTNSTEKFMASTM